MDYEEMKAHVNRELKQQFRPEFLNRVDDLIVFPQLTKEEVRQIVDLMIVRLDKRLAEQQMTIELTEAAGALLIIDEVQTGMGRTGAWMAHHLLAPGVVPDVVTLASDADGAEAALEDLKALLETDLDA